MFKKIALMCVIALCSWSQTIDISSSGWMLKGAVEEINSSSTFDKECVSIVWKYDNGTWRGYTSKPKTILLLQEIGVYDINFTLKQGAGFWINTTSPCIINTDDEADTENPLNLFLGKKVGVYAGYSWGFYDDGLLVMERDWYPNVPLQTARYEVIGDNEIDITWDDNHMTDNVVFDNGLKVDSNFTITGSDIAYGSSTFTIPEISEINASSFGFTKEMLCGEGDYCVKTFYIVEEYPEGTSYLDSMEISATDVVYTEFPPGCTEATCSQNYSHTYSYNITDAKLDIDFPETSVVFSPYTLLQANNHAYDKYGYYNVQNMVNSKTVNMRFYTDKDEAIKYLNGLNGN